MNQQGNNMEEELPQLKKYNINLSQEQEIWEKVINESGIKQKIQRDCQNQLKNSDSYDKINLQQQIKLRDLFQSDKNEGKSDIKINNNLQIQIQQLRQSQGYTAQKMQSKDQNHNEMQNKIQNNKQYEKICIDKSRSVSNQKEKYKRYVKFI
ncbi:hypothetical protein PPERSA_03428 [Pseudocohnilembus persalinus]|uniref:Uncharacterized protein n=1 Tax=Pseudocohnilembus persalinus TaxID=266149 RepID=A0A0V0QBW6_PSEPJ|nr:hypothetical protein PPERSA_03428 [Pseudocohnilembus persalinus]|eukprot:KRW99627.1 hypothetical protein PPERSA_03428 [Pseudocohnilembus persalinus]